MCCVLVAKLGLDLCDPMDYSLQGSSVHAVLQTKILEWVAIPFPRGASLPGIGPRSPTLQADDLPSEPPVFVLLWLISFSITSSGFIIALPRGKISLLIKAELYKYSTFSLSIHPSVNTWITSTFWLVCR